MNNRGSSLIEFLLTLTVLVILLSGLLLAGYVGFARIWLRYSSYEAAICLARGEYETKCRQELETRINNLLIAEPIQNVQLNRFKKLAEVRFDVRLVGSLRAFETRRLRLPLTAHRRNYVSR